MSSKKLSETRPGFFSSLYPHKRSHECDTSHQQFPTVKSHARKAAKVLSAFVAITFMSLSSPMPAKAQTIGDLKLLGAGLNGLHDYSGDNAFSDAYFTARDPEKASGSGSASVDGNGWPTEDFSQYLWAGDAKPLGVYKFSALLPGKPANPDFSTFGGRISNYVYNASTGAMSADINFDTGQGSEDLRITIKNTNGGARNIKVIRPGYTASDFFTTPFINLNTRASVLRMMDWTQTNFNPTSAWSERNSPNSARIGRNLKLTNFAGNDLGLIERGVPWEYCIKLANQLDKDIWINVPHKATDDYVTKLAQLVRYGSDGLNPYTSTQSNPVWAPLKSNLNVYVEYSNETWNDGFNQADWVRDVGKDYVTRNLNNGFNLNWDNLPNTSSLEFGERYAGVRTKQVSDIFKNVFGASAINTRVRVVVGSKIGQPSEFIAQRLSAIEQNFGSPRQYLWSLAVAPYFGISGQFKDDLAVRNNLTATNWLDELEYGEGGVDQWFNPDKSGGQAFATNLSLALHNGLKMTAYEGGPDTFTYGSPMTQNATDSRAAAMRATRMKTITQKYLLNWYANGGDLFNYFVTGVGGFDFSITEAYDVYSQKMQAFDAVLASQKPALTIGTAVPNDVPATYSAGSTRRSESYWSYVRTGWLQNYIVRANSSGNYSLKWTYDQNSSANNVMRVIVNGNTIGNDVAFPGNESYATPTFKDSSSVTIPLNAGLNNVRLYLVNGDTSIQTLKFTNGGTTPTPTPTPTPTQVPNGNGTGLKGEYFSTSTFTNLVKTQTDPTINFTWPGSPTNNDGTPITSIGGDNFSVRWTGQIQAVESGVYTISAVADDTSKIWINDLTGSPIVNQTAYNGGNPTSGTFTMNAGQKYNIKIDFTEATGGAAMKLYWTRPGSNSVIVPQTQLYPDQTSTGALVDRTLETGGIITARGDNAAAGEGKEKAFDNNTSSKWLDFSNTSYLQYQFANNASQVITRYELTSGNDSPGRDPKNWTLQASNDGTNFVTLTSQSNQTFASRNLTRTFDFSNSTAYKMYRLNITANNDGGSITQLSEMRLWGPGGTSTSGTSVTLQNPGFESGTLSGWLYGGSAIGVNTAARKSGAYNSFNNGSYNSIFQNVTVLPNTSYTLKAWARLASAASGQNQCIYVTNNGVTSTAWINGTTYQQYTVNFTTGSNTSVEIGNYDNGSNVIAYTDDYTLTKN